MTDDLDTRVLAATGQMHERSPARIAGLAGCDLDVALSTLRRLRVPGLVEMDGSRPSRWLRTRNGDDALEREAS